MDFFFLYWNHHCDGWLLRHVRIASDDHFSAQIVASQQDDGRDAKSLLEGIPQTLLAQV